MILVWRIVCNVELGRSVERAKANVLCVHVARSNLCQRRALVTFVEVVSFPMRLAWRIVIHASQAPTLVQAPLVALHVSRQVSGSG